MKIIRQIPGDVHAELPQNNNNSAHENIIPQAGAESILPEVKGAATTGLKGGFNPEAIIDMMEAGRRQGRPPVGPGVAATPEAETVDDLPAILAKYKSDDNLLRRLLRIDSNKLPKIVSLAEMEADQTIERPTVLIEGLLHKGEKMVVAGTSKSFKTWSLVDLGLSVAAGKSWWGRKATQSKVLYVNFEIQDFFIRERSTMVAKSKNIVEEKKDLNLWNLRGYATDFAILRDTIATTAGNSYGLIIIDPIYKLLGDRDENKAGDIARMLNEFEKLAVMTGSAVVFGHHYSKGNQATKDPMDRMGGSGVFARDPDTLINLTKHQADECFVVECQTRNFAPVKPFCIRWDWKQSLMIPDDKLDPAKLKKPGQNQAIYNKEETFDVILEYKSRSYTEWYEEVEKRTRPRQGGKGMSETTFRNHVKWLEANNRVKKDEDKHYRVVRDE